MKNGNFYKELFFSTFWISALTVGGGYVIVPLLKKKYVDEYGWISDKDVLDYVSIAQSAPGVIAVNGALILGYRMAGIGGMLTALMATILPPLITITAIYYAYSLVLGNPYVIWALKGMQLAATAMIADVALKLIYTMVKKRDVASLVVALAAFLANFLFDVNVMYIVVVCAMIGFFFFRYKE